MIGNGPGQGRLFSERSLGGSATARRVLRLGARTDLGAISALPPRYRGSLGGPSGVLVSARLRARTSEVWCRLRAPRPWARAVHTVPLSAAQPPTPTPDTVDLRHGARVECPGGWVGRLEGLVVETRSGLATGLLVRVRDDVGGDVAGPTSPLAPLLRVAGARLLVPPAWATKAEEVPGALPFLPKRARLLLAASAAQIAAGLVLRDDAALTAGVWNILAENPAIAPLLPGLRIAVRDGTVTLLGRVPSARHRLSAEQDVWHVPGVLAVRDEIEVCG